MLNAIVHQGRGEPGPEVRNVAIALASRGLAAKLKAIMLEPSLRC
jgi:hypothetical protein